VAKVRNDLVATSTDVEHSAEDQCPRYRLDVVARSAADVVQSAGGWLFDRARAGWAVTVLLAGSCDTRSLRILGLRAVHLNSQSVSDLVPTANGTPGQSLAVSAEVFAADVHIREKVLKALDHHRIEVALWGEGWPAAIGRTTTMAQHVLSPAARVFKGHALAAAGTSCAAVEPAEQLLSNMASRSSVASELIRVG
jgi:hypothetical protein